MNAASDGWIPLAKPEIGAEDTRAVLAILESGQLAMGEQTAEFEAAWAAYCGVRHAVMMVNATLALEALLRSLGIGRGDEVITVAFTFSATVSAILQVGATPVFVDVSDDDFCLDARLLEEVITPRTRAILPVHLFGLPADMAPIREFASRHGLQVVEDAAQAHGAEYAGQKVGSFGPAIFSLYATKNLMAGEGGVITTDDDELADRLRLYRSHGARVRDHHEELGSNLRPTDIVAGLALAQLARLDERNARRQRNAEQLSEALASRYLTPNVPPRRVHVWHQYTMRFPGQRDAVRSALAGRGIESAVHYPLPLHRQPYVRQALSGSSEPKLPVTDRLASEVLSLPVRPNLGEGEVERIIAAVGAVARPAIE
jgi:dTDP-4-amino-4,6-dideoxygalactose transaminase